MTTVVLGAGGAIGSHVVDALVARGTPVRAVTRTPVPDRPGVEAATADLRDPARLREALAGATAVVHAAQPAYTRWAQEFPSLTAAIADAAGAAGARLVLADNLYCYGPVDRPLTEDLPAAATDTKGQVRARMAEDLLHRHDRGELEVVIGRVSDYYGPRGVNSVAGATLFGPAIAGQTIRMIGSPDQPHTWHYLPDVGRALALLAAAPEASGQVWHLPAAPPMTQRELATAVAHAAGREPRISALPGPLHRLLALGHPMLRELWGTRYQLTAPFVVDDSRFRTHFPGVEPTPHADAIAATVAWFRTEAAA
jgi:nucleoside-diphosphate-sugar epimerase